MTNEITPNTTFGDITSDRVYYRPTFATDQMDLSLAALALREGSKSPTESVCSFDLMSAVGEDGEQNIADELASNGTAGEVEEQQQHTKQNNQQNNEKKCFAILKVRPISVNSTAAHCPNLKFEFVSKNTADNGPTQQQQLSTAASSSSSSAAASSADEVPPIAPSVGQMSVDILSRHFGLTWEQLMAQFVLKLQIRERVDDTEAVFMDIEEAEWDTKLVEHRTIYKAMLYPKLVEEKNSDGKGDVKVPKLPADAEPLAKRGGQIVFKMANFKSFSKGCGPKIVFSEPSVPINGMPWRIRVKHCDECVRVDLFCAADQNDMAWSCRAAFTVGVLSCTNSDVYVKKKGNLDEFRPFDAIGPCWGCEIAKIEKMMDPKNDFYDEKADVVTFKAEVSAEAPKGMPSVQNWHTLVVNGKTICVNKYILAAHSVFFRKLFFAKNAEKTPRIQLEGNAKAVPNFERMIATMAPMNLELDDGCVENVLLLAHRFQLDSVLNRCADFLLKKSKKTAICKFRLAHQCEMVAMKKKVLKDMTKDDFAVAGEKFVGNLLDNKQLDAEAVKELKERHAEIFGTK
ncbi:hypothetical protein niasHT_031714 [Heterodera trifolii]|uniref:BTB domain-containing protein n=1 Tax=Heterodera trifolii TaxID=157864 RepID=A0ABD2IY36_9BILA